MAKRWEPGSEPAGAAARCSGPPTSASTSTTSTAPTLIWFAEAHVPADLDGYPDRVPDLCVEIRSQSTWQHDVGAKKRVYEAGGLPELWLVDDAAETVLVYRRSAPESKRFDVELELRCGQALTSPQLPSFSLALDELFER